MDSLGKCKQPCKYIGVVMQMQNKKNGLMKNILIRNFKLV